MVRQALVLLTACYTGTPAETPAQATPPTNALLTIGASHFGPLDANTPATLVPLRRAFAGFTVEPRNDAALSYTVLAGDEEIAWVIPTDDGEIFNVHAKSGKVAVEHRPWRVGGPFTNSALLDVCDCWGDNPTCWRIGDSVAVNLERDCEDVTGEVNRHALRALEGAKIQRIVWMPRGFNDVTSP